MFRHFLFFGLCILAFSFFFAPLFHAYAGDSTYTTQDAEKAAKRMKTRNLPINGLPKKEEEKTETEPEISASTDDNLQKPKKAEDEIWEKYKKLAAGTHEKDSPEEQSEEIQKQAENNSGTTEEEQKSTPGSLLSILEDYKNREANKGKMHSRSMPLPEDRETKKPEQEEPKEEKQDE